MDNGSRGISGGDNSQVTGCEASRNGAVGISVGAEEAASLGLLNEVVEDTAALAQRAGELATLIAGHAPLTLNSTKQALVRLQRRLSREEGEDLILMCYMSRDFREGLDAFLNKRPPQWRGE